MPTTVTANRDTDLLQEGTRYEVLRATKDAFLILLGRKTDWFRRDLFNAA